MDARFLRGLARAYGGAILFALPLFMTMEMWQLGFYMRPERLLILLLLVLPLLVGLSYFSGFEDTFNWKKDVVDACVAFTVGITSASGILLLVGAIGFDTSGDEVAGKIILQSIPASMGALLAQSQFGSSSHGEGGDGEPPPYYGELFLMAAGAIFVAFNVAPTQEIVVIAERIAPLNALLIVVISMIALHAFVYAMEFQGHAELPAGANSSVLFVRYSVVGYAIALLLSSYLLWTFDRMQGMSWFAILSMIVVLGFPAAIGAAAARLIL